jgi:DNA-binding CsgD family transcriptional regulator/tetratricopeptide (TPR) repeat protein
LRETGSLARTSSSGVYVLWLVVGHEAWTSNTASTLCPVMVGRGHELAQLQRAWQAGGHMLVVRGQAGIGKSRLIREFADWVRDAGGTVLAGRCSPTAGDVPFRPLREALFAAARVGLAPSSRLTAFRPTLGSLVPEWSGEYAGGLDGGLIVLAEGVLRLMVEWSSTDAPALLVIEDLHWADRETLEVIEYLADNLCGHAALVVATLRDDEPGPGGELVSALWARRAIQPISLSPLDPAESEVMLRECLNATSLLPELIDAVVARSDGVPFFIEELLAAALGEANSWRLVPGSIAAAVDVRFRLLPESTARFLGFAAMLGRNFDWHVVAAATGCPPLEAIDRLRQAARAQLIDTDGAGFRFRHALTAEAVRSSLLPEERKAICANLLETLQLLHPGLEGETCQLAASLAVEVGDQLRAADLWLEAARRALREGSLGSAEALALRAQGAWPLAADRVLLSTWTIAGQPRRALEAGRRILSAGDCDPANRIEVLFELVDAMITAGRWDDAESYLETLRSAPGLDRPGAARRAIGEAEVALARNDTAAAVAFARAALVGARDSGPAEVTCRALWVIGRVERGSGTNVARAAFEEAYECASRNALPVFRVKSLQELGTIDMFETLSTARFDEARREALAAGAISMVAMVDLQLAATYSARGQAALTLAAAARCEEASRRFGLASLPTSLALQAVAHGFSGNRTAMEAAVAQARAIEGDRDTVEMIMLANGVALYHLGEGRLPEALDAMDRAMDALRAAGGARDFPGRWALLRTVTDTGGEQARDECRRLSLDTAMSRATLRAAEAVAAGREGGDAASIFAAADCALGRIESGFTRSLARLLAAPCAYRDGWGEPVVWVREALSNFEDLGLPNFVGQCRAALRAMGEAVPRQPRSQARRVTGLLAARGVTPREAEVLAQVAAGRSNREIAGALHLSVRTVEKHVERLLMKTGHSRAELARFADGAGVQPAV